MLLPTTYAVTISILFLTLICWGSWANTLKKSKFRFELYYIDFALGALVFGLVLAFTVGSMGPDLSVQDNFLLSGKKQVLYAFSAGCVFGLANMLIVAGIDLAGMSVAIPVGMGMALIANSVWNFAMAGVGNPLYLFGGLALVLVAIVLIAIAHAKAEGERQRIAAAIAAEQAALVQEAEPTATAKKKRAPEKTGPSPLRGVWLALAGGLVLAGFLPLVGLSMEAELGLSNPFAVAMVAAVGILGSTFIYNLYFMNLPVRGLPISFFAYFTGTLGQHLLGLLGGALWIAGTCAFLLSGIATGEAKVTPSLIAAFGNGSIVLAAIWGLLVWKEFAGADGGVKKLLGAMLLALVAGIALVSVGLA